MTSYRQLIQSLINNLLASIFYHLKTAFFFISSLFYFSTSTEEHLDNDTMDTNVESNSVLSNEQAPADAAGASATTMDNATWASVNDENSHISINDESSQSEKGKTSIQSLTTLSISREGEVSESRDENARDESMMENLQDRLTSMRDGFLEK